VPRRYLIAFLIGLFIGFLALLTQGFLLEGLLTDSWEIPTWGRIDSFNSPKILTLVHQALVLRTCNLFLEHGFAYLLVPAFAGCALVKLTALGRRHAFIRCVANMLWLSVWLAGGTAILGFLMGTGTTCQSNPPNLEEVFYNCWGGAHLVLWILEVSWLLPSIAFLVFLVQIGIEYGFFVRHQTGVFQRFAITALVAACFALIGTAISANSDVSQYFYVTPNPTPADTTAVAAYHSSFNGSEKNVQLVRRAMNLLFWKDMLDWSLRNVLGVVSVFLVLRSFYETIPPGTKSEPISGGSNLGDNI
jgi:hypothetical protein